MRLDFVASMGITMRRTMPAFAKLVVLGALLFAAAPAQTQTQSGKQIFQSWLGRTLDYELADGRKGVSIYATDGTAKASGAVSDTGKWRVTDDGYCVTWTRIRGGSERCFTITPWGSSFLLVTQGTTEVVGTITPR